MNYSHLFSEGTIGSLTLKNRVVMPAMGTALCNADGSVSDHQIAYYEERASGGAGLIIIEVACVEGELGRAVTPQLLCDEDRFIPGLSRLANVVKKYGARVFLQLHHAGNQSNSRITGGKRIVAPSAVTSAAVGEEPRALETEEVKELAEKYINAAVRARMAGMDGVELHGAHGYLICEFLSPHTNRRTDEYGGSFENRMRFAEEIIAGIKEKCGKEFPVTVRFSADEFIEGGIDLEYGERIAKYLEQAGADALDVSCGTYESMHRVIEPLYFEEGWRSYISEAVRSQVSIPVITAGVIRRPEKADDIIGEDKADFIAVGRGHITDPDWALKAREGVDEYITPCIGCLYCLDAIFRSNPVRCAVNPRAGRELEFGLSEDGQGKKVAVIGGGPAGMQAATELALRGFSVDLYEKEKELGGLLVPGCVPPGKEVIRQYKDSLVKNLEMAGVNVNLGVNAAPGEIAGKGYSALYAAVGANPVIPADIPGIGRPEVCTATDILLEKVVPEEGEETAVIGGGLTGCETAEYLEGLGAKVTIVEALEETASGESVIIRTALRERLKDSSIKILTGKKLSGVYPGEVELAPAKGGESVRIKADRVILSLGYEAPEDTGQLWKKAAKEVFVVGDAVQPKKVAEAVRSAFDGAWVLEPLNGSYAHIAELGHDPSEEA